MPILQVEHEISDYDTWKRAFEADPLQREQSGVRAYRVYRPQDGSRYIRIDLDFDTASAAEEFHGKLQQLWQSGRAAPALVGSGNARIVDEVMREDL
jgi:hypothetical protein